MFGFKRRLSIAEQVSSSLKNPEEWSDAEVIESVSEKSDSDMNSYSAKGELEDEIHDGPDEESRSRDDDQTTAQPQSELPSLEECLFGPGTSRSPFIPDDGETSEDGDDNALNNMSINDIGLSSRWSQDPDVRADYHDIDMAVLRKLCSHGSGIPDDEGPRGEDDDDNSDSMSNPNAPKTRGTCHRGVAWRVLLEQLPVRDIHATWSKTLPPQRKLYWELVEKYMEDAIDPGNCLKGESHWEQTLRLKENASKRSLNNDTCGGRDEISKDGDENDAGDKTNQQQQKQQQQGREDLSGPESSLEAPYQAERDHKSIRMDSSAHIRATEDIYDVFPTNSKYKELWRKLGITLNQGESAAAIGMNRLRVPKELLLEDSERNNGESNVIEGKDEANDDSDAAEIADAPAYVDSTESGTSNESQRDQIFEQFCKDAHLLSEIRKDVVRTNPHLSFYLDPRNRLGIRRHAALERVLFVWAKLNDNLYVQGMNEIVGTIYYVLAMDPTTSNGSSIENKRGRQHSWADHAEVDAYYLFDALLNKMEVRDVFVADLDHDSPTGLHARIKNIEMLLKEHDPEIFNHLKIALGLDSSFYAIRWLTTLLSREFRLPDTIRLWDSMLASTHKENFLRYVCASMVMAVRDRLLRGDFGTCIKLLQNYPSGEIGMDELLESSRALWIYETQISLACQKGGVQLRQALNLISPPDGVIMAFGRPGGKSPNLGEQILNNVASTTVAANNNVGKFMGRAKSLLSWTSPAKTQKKTISKFDANEDEDEWDLIDSILDGKTQFVSGIMNSTTSSPADTSAVAPNQEESTDSKNVDTPPATPTSGPQRLWDSFRPDDILDNDNIVEDYSNNDGSLDQVDLTGARTNAGFWNRIRRSY